MTRLTDKDWRDRFAKLRAKDGAGRAYFGYGDWLIFPPTLIGNWQWQHDDAEPGDPRHGISDSLLGCIEAVEDYTAENCCEACGRDTRGEFAEGTDWCGDCATDKARDHAEAQEAAADDRAHAAMDARAGL